MRKIKIITLAAAVAVLSLVSFSAYADFAGWNRGGPVTLIYTTPTYIYAKLQSVTLAPDMPACPDTSYIAFHDIDENSGEYKRILSLLLVSKATGAMIGFGSEGCNGAGMRMVNSWFFLGD